MQYDQKYVAIIYNEVWTCDEFARPLFVQSGRIGGWVYGRNVAALKHALLICGYVDDGPVCD